jgi:hypothetical protein
MRLRRLNGIPLDGALSLPLHSIAQRDGTIVNDTDTTTDRTDPTRWSGGYREHIVPIDYYA